MQNTAVLAFIIVTLFLIVVHSFDSVEQTPGYTTKITIQKLKIEAIGE